MSKSASILDNPAGWSRNAQFDNTFIGGVALIALLSGLAVIVRPSLFWLVLLADLWLLGYHHVVATFTRLAFDRNSLREYRFFVFALPVIVFSVTFAAAWTVGIWVIATVYLYWQWFHYTRQSWGISQVYRAKSGGRIKDSAIFSQLCFYLVPAWGILYRSWQAPDTFLFVELQVIPIPELLVDLVGIAATASMIVWCYTRIRAWREGQLPLAHTYYMLSHFLIFLVGYRIIDDITVGWLVINVWHNAQYVLFVWLFNVNKFKAGVEPKAPFLSTICQPQNFIRYFFVCIGISTLIYLSTSVVLSQFELVAGLPLAVIFYQAVNFHHYIVDSRIWKVRKKTMRKTLELGGSNP